MSDLLNMPLALRPNALYYNDCLDVLAGWEAEVFDLVYMDPPWNSKRDYNVMFRDAKGESAAQQSAFNDTWRWDEAAQKALNRIDGSVKNPARNIIMGLYSALGRCEMMAYLVYMAERLIEIKRVMKANGSIFYHCDANASAYIKVLMDALFKPDNFRNEIVWRKYSGRKNNAKRKFATQHDTIFFYAAEGSQFHRQYEPHSAKEIAKKYKYTDEDGRRYRLSWGRQYQLKGEQRRIYLDESPGRAIGNLWVEDGLQLNTSSAEKTGWQTQKPRSLLHRVLAATTQEGDWVLDPFCGCGTTVVQAHLEDRVWTGIDVSPLALDIVERELHKSSKNPGTVPKIGYPDDMKRAEELAKRDPFAFEKWAASRIPGIAPNAGRGGDGGIDGRGITHGDKKKVVVQVKGGGYTIGDLRAFRQAMRDDGNATFGLFITLRRNTTRSHRAKVAEWGDISTGAKRYPRVQLWSIEEFFDGKEPVLPTMAAPGSGEAIQTSLL